MSTSKAEVARIISHTATPVGFKKEGVQWRKETEEAFLCIESQRSKFGDQFYINLGVYLKQWGPLTNPRAFECHLAFRLEDVLPIPEQERLASYLDFEAKRSSKNREQFLATCIGKKAIPYLNSLGTLDGIRKKATAKSGAKPPWLTPKIQNLL